MIFSRCSSPNTYVSKFELATNTFVFFFSLGLIFLYTSDYNL